jgi:UDP-N-acetylglucosamine 1-carboxyvinyltransferase
MDRFRIQGGTPLSGEVEVAGSKNAALPILASTLLLEGEASLSRVPRLRDVETMCGLLESLDCAIVSGSGLVQVRADATGSTQAPYGIVRKMRASICVLGPLLARRGTAEAALPGGCVLGARPIDIHLRGLESLGATLSLDSGVVRAKASRGGLQGGVANLQGPRGSTVLGTANILMAATLARGDSTLKGCAREPEIKALAEFLNACGARIEGHGSSEINIQGVDRLHGVPWTIPSDRIEAGTLLLAGAATGGKVRVTRMAPAELRALFEVMEIAGAPVQTGPDWAEVDAETGRKRATSVTTGPWPDFPTDLQAQWTAFAAVCEGRSEIKDSVYPERFLHVAELRRMGADAGWESGKAWVEGPSTLQGAPVIASDLRASAALVIGGLAATGETLVKRIYHLDRGYESLETKLATLGGRVVREPDPESP